MHAFFVRSARFVRSLHVKEGQYQTNDVYVVRIAKRDFVLREISVKFQTADVGEYMHVL
jgi:hypothetical protein